MGCCQSTRADESPDGEPVAARANNGNHNSDAIPHDSSRAAINRPARPISNVESPSLSASSVIAPRNGRPNTPLEPVNGKVAKSPGNVQFPAPWTRTVLREQREQFWGTRVTGSQEGWGVVRMVCESLQQGNVVDAQGILNAANLTCPTGMAVRYSKRDRQKAGIYDERGELYDVPAWVVRDPEDVVEDGAEKSGMDGAGDEEDEEDMDKDGLDDEDSLAVSQRRRDEKGKGRAADPGDMMTVRARLSDRATDVGVQIGSKQKVATMVRGVQDHFGAKRVRLMYMGRVLDERKTLAEQGWVQGHVVNALVFEGDESMLGSKSLETRTKGLQSR